MKKLIPIVLILFAVGCSKSAKEDEVSASKDKVVGEYHILGDPSKKVALRAGGIMHSSEDGKPNEDEEGTWSVKNGEVYISVDEGTLIFEIKGDGNLQIIARLKNDGVREDAPEDARKNGILKKVK